MIGIINLNHHWYSYVASPLFSAKPLVGPLQHYEIEC